MLCRTASSTLPSVVAREIDIPASRGAGSNIISTQAGQSIVRKNELDWFRRSLASVSSHSWSRTTRP